MLILISAKTIDLPRPIAPVFRNTESAKIYGRRHQITLLVMKVGCNLMKSDIRHFRNSDKICIFGQI
jgi:hypothetical protein